MGRRGALLALARVLCAMPLDGQVSGAYTGPGARKLVRRDTLNAHRYYQRGA
jgi:hypothetical protein